MHIVKDTSLLYRFGNKTFFCQWRMERYLEVVEDRLRSALEQMRGSSAGEHYRTLLAALRQFVAKLANSRYGGYRNRAHRYPVLLLSRKNKLPILFELILLIFVHLP
jgi:hypothetical protein